MRVISSRRRVEYRKADDLLHRYGRGSALQPFAKITHDLVEFFESRPPITLATLACDAKTLGYHKCVFHGGPINLRTCLVGDIVGLDRTQNLRLCSTDLLDRLGHVAVDNGGQGRVRRFETLDRAGLGKLFLALFEPGSGGLPPIEGPTFAMNNGAPAFYQQLSICAVVPSLRLRAMVVPITCLSERR